MRIALVCPYAWDRPGGVQSHVGSLARALSERNHEVIVITPTTKNSRVDDIELVAAGRGRGIPANGSVAPISFGPRTARAVARAVTDFRPDVVHAHEPLIPSTSLLALVRSSAPVVGTFHASAERSTGYRLARPILERAAARITTRTAVSDAARDFATRYFPGNYALTPNGVERKRFAGAEPLDLGSRPAVLFLGRIEPRKGLDVLIKAMARLADLRAVLVVAGSGAGEGDSMRLATERGVDVRFFGRVDNSMIAGLYRGATVYCAPGLGGESFGIVLVEAMAAGVPVVASDLPGYRAVAAGAAALAPPGDDASLADVLRGVLTDPRQAKSLVKSGDRIAQMFDWERLVGNVESIYDDAIAQGRKRP